MVALALPLVATDRMACCGVPPPSNDRVASCSAPVVEGFGLRGFGSHTTNAEYILMSSIEPRLYLATRMIMDISSGKAPLQ